MLKNKTEAEGNGTVLIKRAHSSGHACRAGSTWQAITYPRIESLGAECDASSRGRLDYHSRPPVPVRPAARRILSKPSFFGPPRNWDGRVSRFRLRGATPFRPSPDGGETTEFHGACVVLKTYAQAPQTFAVRCRETASWRYQAP